MNALVPGPRRAPEATAEARVASLAAWDAVLDAVDVDLDEAERLLVSMAGPVAGSPGGADQPGSAGGPATVYVGAAAHLPDGLPVDGLTREDLDAILARLRRLDARHRAVVPLLAAAMAANRRHRELLDRASAPTDRPVFVDQRA